MFVGARLKAVLIFLSVIFCFIFSGCQKIDLVSPWRDRDIVIDGKYTDWGDTAVYYEQTQKVVVNIVNNKDYIYICLISRNRQIEAQLLVVGFLVWFDPTGGEDESFGVHFPLEIKQAGMSLVDGGKEPDDKKDKPASKDSEKYFEKRLELLEGLQDKIEIIKGPDKEGVIRSTLEETAKQGIEAKIGHQNGYFVYELKVPLTTSDHHPYAINAKEGIPMGLGLQIAPFTRGEEEKSVGHEVSSEQSKIPWYLRSLDTQEKPFQLWMRVKLSVEKNK